MVEYEFNSVYEELEYIFYNDDDITSSEILERLDHEIKYMQEQIKKLAKFRRALKTPF